MNEHKHEFVVYTIQFSTIKTFLILDMCVGTGIYYAIKVISSSILFATVAASIGTEGIKWVRKRALLFK